MMMLVAAACLGQVSGAELDRLVQRLDDQAAQMQAKMAAAEAKRDVRVSALVSRRHAREDERAYVLATYSFEHGTRDDKKAVRNDWDVSYGNGAGDPLGVRMVTDDASLVWDLGETDFAAPAIPKDPPAGAEKAKAVKGHVYIVHTLDSETDQWAKMQVLELQADEWVIFRWEVVADPARFEAMERRPERMMKSGTVHLQLRGGAGGGNPRRVYIEGRFDACVDRLSEAPLDMRGAPDIDEDGVGFVRGGFIPRGKVWVVRKIEYTALAKGDSNGQGEFILKVNGTRIAAFRDRADEVKDTWTGRIVVRPGEERKVYLEIANSSRADVRLKGALWDEKWAAVEKIPALTPEERRRAETLAAELEGDDITKREAARSGLLEIGPPLVEWLKSLELKGRPALAEVLKTLDGE